MKRWLEKHQDFLKKDPYRILGDDLYANQPMCEAFLALGLGFTLVCKRDSHVELYKTVDFLAANDLVEELEERHWNGRYHETRYYHFVNEVPLRAENPLTAPLALFEKPGSILPERSKPTSRESALENSITARKMPRQ